MYGKTRKEVAEKLTKAIATKDDKSEFVPAHLTFREFLVQYEEVADLHQNYNRLQEEAVCSAPNYYL